MSGGRERVSDSRFVLPVIEFVDPRTDPEPPPRVSREPAAQGDDVQDLARLCSSGRVYDVELWIREGRPIQALTYERPKKPTLLSPLRAAIRKNNPDLALLLLCNGYRLELEGDHQPLPFGVAEGPHVSEIAVADVVVRACPRSEGPGG